MPTVEQATPSAALTITPAQPAASVPQMPAEPSVEMLGNLIYEGVSEEPITLAGGRFEGEPFVEGGAARHVVSLLPEPIAYGDLNDDGQNDTALLLAADSGGSGTFIYLAVVGLQDGQPANLATALLGDRAQIKSLRIEDNRIIADILTQGPDDPQCCPSQQETRTYRLSGDQLIEEDSG